MYAFILDLVLVVCAWSLCGFLALSIPDRDGLRFDNGFTEMIGVAVFPLSVLYLYTVKRHISK